MKFWIIAMASFLIDMAMTTAVVGLIFSMSACSTPGGGPTPGQQAVLMRASQSQAAPADVEKQMLFMRQWQQSHGFTP